MPLAVLLRTLRPSFLVLTPVCVFLGLSTSLAAQASINYFMVALVLLGAVAAHISVNTLNEYHDFKSGLDLKTDRTPFSGGSGALPGNPEMAGLVLTVGLLSLLVTVTVGLYFVAQRGMQILPFGLVGVVLVITYTQWLNRSPWLCLMAPGLGFGVLMVVGTHLVLTGGYSGLVWVVALVPFFLINNLLLLNQYPDIEADASVGRKTLPVVFGAAASNVVYALFMVASGATILFLRVTGYLPDFGIIALLPIGFSLFALTGVMKYAANIGRHPLYLGANVVAAILTPLLLGIALVSG
jgi:1,4-dihydroxy-2-naphthoate octaprenyltransferase